MEGLEIFNYQKGDEIPATEECRECGTTIHTTQGLLRQFPSNTTTCQDCITKRAFDDKLSGYGTAWKSICPPEYRETDKNHVDFNKVCYERMDGIPLEENLLIYGDTGTCKSRSLFLRLKKALVKGFSIGVLFPEDIKEYARQRDRLWAIKQLTRYDILGLDDAFAAGTANDSCADWLKDLIDRRLRHQKTTIITSQLSERDYTEESQKWQNYTAAEQKRVEAIWRRVKDKYTPCLFSALLGGEGALPF